MKVMKDKCFERVLVTVVILIPQTFSDYCVSQALASDSQKTAVVDSVEDHLVGEGIVPGDPGADEGMLSWPNSMPFDASSYRPMPLREHVYGKPQRRPLPPSSAVTFDLTTGVETILDPRLISRAAIETEWSVDLGEGDQEIPSVRSQNFSAPSLVCDPTTGGYQKHVIVFFTLGGTDWACSGTLIDPRVVLTAGHCVHEGDGQTWSTDIIVVPAYDGGREPFGRANGTHLRTWEDWAEDKDLDHDVGLIRLDRPVGALTGWRSARFSDDCDFFKSGKWEHPGYPGDPYDGEHMYTQSGSFDDCDRFLRWWYGNEVSFDRGIYEGQSGSGAVKNDRVYAVLSNGDEDTTYSPRITENKRNGIVDFIKKGTPPSFDLIPLDVHVWPTFIRPWDRNFSMSYLVHNYSAGSFSGAVRVGVYVSTNNIISSADTLIQEREFTYDFEPKSSVRLTTETDLPSLPGFLPGGMYWIGVILDIADSDSTNNSSNGSDAETILFMKPEVRPP